MRSVGEKIYMNSASYNTKCTLAFVQNNFNTCKSLMKRLPSRPNSETYSNINFHEYPSSGIRVFPCGQREGQADMKLTVAFRKSAAEHKKCDGNASILRM